MGGDTARRIKASYIGFGTDDSADFYEMFTGAMRGIGVYDCMQITVDVRASAQQESAAAPHVAMGSTEGTRQMAHLECSDIILIGGGDAWKTWSRLELTGVHERVRWRYCEGACLVGVGSGATLLGEKGFCWRTARGALPAAPP